MTIRPLVRSAVVALIAAAGTFLETQEAHRPVALLDVAVHDNAGLPIKDLTATDIEIVTEGRTVPVMSLVRNRHPLNILLLIDLTASSARFDQELAEDEGEDSFIKKLTDGERAAIGGFARRLILPGAFTNNRAVLRTNLRAAVRHPERETYGPSPIWDHTFEALQTLSKMEGRKALVIVSDGRATGNRRSIEDVARYAVEHSCSISALDTGMEMYIPQGGNNLVAVRPGAGLKWLAEVTGGRAFEMAKMEVKMDERKGTLFDLFLDDLREIYTLRFDAPVADGKLHVVEVRVKRADTQLRAPKVFPAPRTAPAPYH